MNKQPIDSAKVITKTGGILEIVGYLKIDLTANRMLVIKEGGTIGMIPDWQVKDLLYQEQGGLVYHTLLCLFQETCGKDYQPVKEGGKDEY